MEKKGITQLVSFKNERFIYMTVLLSNNMINKEKEIITLRGERNLWIDFVSIVKKERKEVWEVLAPLLSEYVKNKQKEKKK